MAFPESQLTLNEALKDAKDAVSHVREVVQRARDMSAAGSMARGQFINVQKVCDTTIKRWDAAAAVPGIGQYAKDQFKNTSLDIVAEFTAMRAETVALRLWIFSNIPTSNGAVLLHSNSLSGDLVDITQSSASMAGFRAQADSLLALIG